MFASPVGAAERFSLAGYVAGEGSFYVAKRKRLHVDGRPMLRFVFAVSVQTRDLALLEDLRRLLAAGSIHHSAAQRAHWQPLSTYTVNSMKAHVFSTIPFFETHLLPCAKRMQFERWCDSLIDYVHDHHIRSVYGRSTCEKEGCNGIVRGRGLCRRHYYQLTGY